MNFSFKKHNICIGILFFVFNLVNGIEKKIKKGINTLYI